MNDQTSIVGKRILLSDDQQDVREAIKMMLEFDEHTVVEAANGREALALFEPNQFDLVVTDYQMPEMRGDELAANIKRLAPGQPVLMITGSAQPHLELTAVTDAILTKPFTLEELRSAVAELCSVGVR